MPVFRAARGWESLREDILVFADLAGFKERTHTQDHFLLRVQSDVERLGMVGPVAELFPVYSTAMLWRALCWDIPSVIVCEFEEAGIKWVNSMAVWLRAADVAIQQNVQVSQHKRFLVANQIHLAHVLGPFADLSDYTPGFQDVLVLDFDEMPPWRFDHALALADEATLYLPQITDGPLVQRKQRRNAADGPGDDATS
jgi:hypothetical protein